MVKNIFSIILLCICHFYSFSQNWERKIIIVEDTAYTMKIDDENQLVTLYQTSIEQEYEHSIKIELPFGRNYEEPTIPFNWDLDNGNLLVINNVRSAFNDHAKSIKYVSPKQLLQLNVPTVEEKLWLGIHYEPLVIHEPYISFIQSNPILSNFQFDLIGNAEEQWFLQYNQNNLSLWHCKQGEWFQKKNLNINLSGTISLNQIENRLFVTSKEKIFYFDWKDDTLQEPVFYKDLEKECIVIENKTKQQLHWVSIENLALCKTTVELISKHEAFYQP